MKKYFAKYLPVEGEIKEGDYWTKEGRKSFSKIFDIDKKISSPLKEKYPGIKTKGDYLKVTGAKLGKLFLCSRDIQVGDEYYNEQFEFTKYPNKSIADSSTEMVGENGSYKVIGEISPDAIWVKEGDEFDEDELEPVLFYSKHPDESIYMDTISNIEEWKKLNPDNKKNRYIPMIEIKCPTCKNYH